MKKIVFAAIFFSFFKGLSQVNETQTGAWYIYFFSKNFKESPFGFQGDVQYRNWNLIGDLEQLLIRFGPTYTVPKTKLKVTAGFAHITSGEFGPGMNTTAETRFYQELLLPHSVLTRVHLSHRLRTEQRFVEHQNFRTRYRYALLLNIGINKRELVKNAVYLALYNEVFVNGERNIGAGKTVDVLDRNRAYSALGFMIENNLRVQMGIMNQTSTISKNQLQLSVHHSF